MNFIFVLFSTICSVSRFLAGTRKSSLPWGFLNKFSAHLAWDLLSSRGARMPQGRASSTQGPLSLTPVEVLQPQPGMWVLTTAPNHAGTPRRDASSSPYPALDLRWKKILLFPGFLQMQHSTGNAVSMSTWYCCGLGHSSKGQVTKPWEAGCDPEYGHTLLSPQERVVMLGTAQQACSLPELHKRYTNYMWYLSKFSFLFGIPAQKTQ